ncbi:MAG: ATP-binding protein [Planctomycetota bacterium]|nr:ATP-binding protein [Planctomycetota bacterium]
MASIQVIQGADKGRSFELREGPNVIGRECEGVELADPTVSRRHCQIGAGSSGQWILEDLGSANGTFLNGVRGKKPWSLNRGAQIRCGSSLLVFTTLTGPGAAAGVDIDEKGNLVDAAIVATLPSNEDSVIIPTPEAGAEAIDNLRILYGLVAEVSRIFDVRELLNTTLDHILSHVTADRGHILLLGENGELTPAASRLPEGSRSSEIPISRTIIDEVVRKQVGVQSTNAMSDQRFHAGKSVHNFGIRSAICVPLKGRGRILGVIHIDCSVSDHTYSTEQLRLLTAIGYQVGLAVENVALHEAAVQSERLAAVGETVAQLSHHIKNILQALRAGTDVVEIALRGADLKKATAAWPLVQRSLGRINDLIMNMLAFSKEREPLMAATDVNETLNECIELITAQADERGVPIMTDLKPLPTIPADSAGLQQAMINLLSNALDAVASNTGVITVTSRHDTMNRTVVVQVIDNGSGIESDRLPYIFQPFYSGKGQAGTGLGLTVAKKTIAEHRGSIVAKSTPGGGTTFTLTLPALPFSMHDTDVPI